MIKLSTGLNIAWKIASLEAVEKRSESIEVIHFILGLLSFDKIPVQQSDDQNLNSFIQERKKFYEILLDHHIDITKTRRILRSLLPQGSAIYRDNIIHRSEDCKNVLTQASNSSGNYITSLDYFAVVIIKSNYPIQQHLLKSNIDIESLRRHLTLANESIASSVEIEFRPPINDETETTTTSTKYKYLSKYGRDMVSMAEKSMYSLFEGRSEEIRQLITTLGKKTKNNPIIIGEPGVGKTAIVEGLSQMIFQGIVLPGRRIFHISATSLVSGTKFRGEFEERLLKIIDEATKFPEVILFFDEIHQFIGAGGSEGGLDAANILKPALSRQGFTCIGATTSAEYRKYIEKDAAFTRRFQTIIVNEPSAAETINILNRIKPELERYHNVIIHESALQASVDFSIRYETNKCLPDKAIDLLDETCSALSNKTMTIVGLKRLSDESPDLPEVDSICVAKLLSRRTGIPLSNITQHDAQKFSKLEVSLKEKIKGQDEIVMEIANYIKISKAGMGDPNKPIGVFLFIGPTGVGKTFLAKTLAASLFSSESDLVRYDMSEYMEQHAVSKLIGSPPGYVLSDEEGILIKNLRDKPYSVVLFDEIDKAHPRILDVLLQLFDEGRITDNKGRLIDGRHAIFILTSNFIDSERKSVGFNLNEKKMIDVHVPGDLKKMFRQEFLNRINKILVFKSLNKNDIEEIINENLNELFTLLKDKFHISIRLSGSLTNYILERCSYEKYGARSVTRTIDKMLKEPISNYIIDSQAMGKTISGCSLEVMATEQKIEFTISEEAS